MDVNTSLSFLLEKKNGYKQKKIPLMIKVVSSLHHHHTTLISVAIHISAFLVQSHAVLYVCTCTFTTCNKE